jgi:hypothetical protein
MIVSLISRTVILIRDLSRLSGDQKLLSHFSETGAAILSIE